jgi:hypothetical protein
MLPFKTAVGEGSEVRVKAGCAVGGTLKVGFIFMLILQANITMRIGINKRIFLILSPSG